jgi:hypothetical protein
MGKRSRAEQEISPRDKKPRKEVCCEYSCMLKAGT